MRNKLVLFFMLIDLVIFGFEIYKKENILKSGKIVYIELAPLDPRSIMQGDYMRLRYKVDPQKKSTMVMKLDERNIAQFYPDNKDQPLKPNEYRVYFYHDGIRPNSYLFQEGNAKLYEAAKYGIFKFDPNNNKLLIGLADKDLNVLKP